MIVGSLWRARRRRHLGYAAGALLLAAVVFTAGSWLAVRAWGPELARERLEPALSAALGRPVRVERVGIEPWLGRVVVTGVTAAALPGEAGPHLFTLGRVEANIGVSSLWRRRLVLRSVRLDDLDLRLSAGAGPALREIPILPEVIQAGPSKSSSARSSYVAGASPTTTRPRPCAWRRPGLRPLSAPAARR